MTKHEALNIQIYSDNKRRKKNIITNTIKYFQVKSALVANNTVIYKSFVKDIQIIFIKNEDRN